MVFEIDSPAGNMKKDIEFFALHDRPVFRFYGFNSDCITAGYSQDIASEIDLEKAGFLGIDIARRPTGGGIVFHSDTDIAFCCVLPLRLFPGGFMSAYHFVSDIVLDVLKHAGVRAEKCGGVSGALTADRRLCFSDAKEYEIAFEGKKLVGIAQKRTKEKILQQGAICVSRPRKDMLSVLMEKCAGKGLPAYGSMLNEITGNTLSRDELLSSMTKIFSERFEKLAVAVL